MLQNYSLWDDRERCFLPIQLSELIARNQNTEALTDWNRTANNKNVDVVMSQINNTHFIEDCPAWHFKNTTERAGFMCFNSLHEHISCRLSHASESIINNEKNWWSVRVAIGFVAGNFYLKYLKYLLISKNLEDLIRGSSREQRSNCWKRRFLDARKGPQNVVQDFN